MKLQVLKTALEYLDIHTLPDENFFEDNGITNEDVKQALYEIKCMEDAAPEADYCDETTIIPTELMLDFGNKMWYNTYGRMARRLPNGRDIPANFFNAVRQEEYVTEVSDLILQDVYDFLHDLWADNERDGENDTDGTFKQPLICSDIDMIQDLVNDKLNELHGGEEYDRYLQLAKAIGYYRQDRAQGFHAVCADDDYLGTNK